MNHEKRNGAPKAAGQFLRQRCNPSQGPTLQTSMRFPRSLPYFFLPEARG